jgi:hypothetical protein
MDGGHVIPEAIQGLLEKRGTFQEWLSRLEELGSEFRPEVADKVRSDYAGRLAAVETELEGHRSELESVLADRTEAVEKVANQHDARSAELEETQLRHVVGEFDDEEWELRRAEHQAEIDELEAELNTQRSAVEALDTVLAELSGAGPGPAVVESVATEKTADIPETEEAEEQEAADEQVLAEESGDSADAWMTQPFDEAEPGTDQEEDVEDVEGVEDVVTAEMVETDVVESEYANAEYVEAEVVDVDAGLAEETEAEEPETLESEAEPAAEQGEAEEFTDELEFLESLSLDDPETFDAVSALLDEDSDSADDDGSDRKSEDL